VTTAYVGVGSNVDPEANVPEALRRLARQARVTGVSTFYRTAALRAPGAPDFANGVWRVETELGPRALKFDVLRAIEEELGRRRTADGYAPRTIDLDVLLCGAAVVREPDLVLPDPEIVVRPFVAVPLWELEPGLVLPGSGRRLAEVVGAMSRTGLEPWPALTERLRAEVAG